MILWGVLPLLVPVLISISIAYHWGAPLSLPPMVRFVLSLAVSLGALRVYWYIVLGGSIWQANMSRTASMALDIWFYSALVLFGLVALRGFVNVGGKLFMDGKILIDTANTSIGLGILAVSLVIGCAGVMNGYGMPVIKHYSVALKGLPAEAEGYRIAFVADTHICSTITRERVQDIVDLTQSAKPDLIALGGDYKDGAFELLKDKLQEFVKFSAPGGVYAVTGNHDGYGPDRERFLRFYVEHGIRFLANEHAVIRNSEGKPLFTLSGVHDPVFGTDLGQALQHADKDIPIIMLSHRPALFDRAAGSVGLMLAGHTHGGSDPLLSVLVANANGGFVAGEYEKQGSTLIVSRGTQQWMGWAFRIFNPPEIVVVTLDRAN